MEIKYTNFELDPCKYNKDEITGVIDTSNDFIYNNFYDVREVSFNKESKVFIFLISELIFKNNVVKEILEKLGLERNIMSKKMKNLSSSELFKVELLKLMLNSSKVIILDHINLILMDKDIKRVISVIKEFTKDKNKNTILVTNNPDTLIKYSDNYIIARNGEIQYLGSNIEEYPIKTSIVEFVELANNKEANLKYYKDRSDLLKAIYRSVKK